MGIDPIGYKPWTGTRTSKRQRVMVIAKTLFRAKIKSKGVLILLILGGIGVWAFPIIFNAIMPHENLDASTMAEQMGDSTFFIFSVLLASVVCSDAISEDMHSNSFVLYFSRAIKTEDYLAGKAFGIITVLALFCFLPAILMAAIIMGTQSGGDYLPGLGVLARTVAVSAVATLFLIPISLFISSLTKRKSHAAIGTFMVFLALSIIGGLFSFYDSNWNLVNPGGLLAYLYDWMYGFGIPHDVSGGLLAAMTALFTAVPLALVYLRIHLKAVGK